MGSFLDASDMNPKASRALEISCRAREHKISFLQVLRKRMPLYVDEVGDYLDILALFISPDFSNNWCRAMRHHPSPILYSPWAQQDSIRFHNNWEMLAFKLALMSIRQ